MNPDAHFWRGRRVLLTGHTGFKGSWLAVWLKRLGARVFGLALPPDTDPSLWRETGGDLLDGEMLADLTDPDTAREAVRRARPSVALHLAAQSLVRRSFARPVETFATNLMGTIHLLEALRTAPGLDVVLTVTSDKVYAQTDPARAFVEGDPLGGDDPYSASKAAAEIAAASYGRSFFEPGGVKVAAARAGNVIGGGDWSEDRLVPDIWRAASRGEPVLLRNPDSVRPWQHVLEPLAGYLRYAEALAQGPAIPAALNFGPLPGETSTVAEVADAMSAALGIPGGWRKDARKAPIEAKFLSVSPQLATASIGWRPRLTCAEAIEWSARWYSQWQCGADALELCAAQIDEYERRA